MRAEDFRLQADNDGDLSLTCPQYAEGCWWDVSVGDDERAPGRTLAEYLALAAVHLAQDHRPVVEGTVVRPG